MNNNNKIMYENKKKINLHLITLKDYSIVCDLVSHMSPPLKASSGQE